MPSSVRRMLACRVDWLSQLALLRLPLGKSPLPNDVPRRTRLQAPADTLEHNLHCLGRKDKRAKETKSNCREESIVRQLLKSVRVGGWEQLARSSPARPTLPARTVIILSTSCSVCKQENSPHVSGLCYTPFQFLVERMFHLLEAAITAMAAFSFLPANLQ